MPSPVRSSSLALPLLLPLLTALILLLQGCVVPGYPYGYGAPVPQGGVVIPPAGAVAVAPSAMMMPGMVPVNVLPDAYAPPQIVVAPTFYTGCGWGYWYGNRFWGYRPNCGFWRGHYYNGYRWNGYRPGVHGGTYPYHGGYQGGYNGGSHGVYQGQGGWNR